NSYQYVIGLISRDSGELSGEQGPLGIHVVPYCSLLSGQTLGLHIKSIEANSRSMREGLFREDECIVQISGTELMDKTFAQSQEVFRQAMCSPLVRLEILPLANKQRYEKRLIGQLFTDSHDSVSKAMSPLVIHQKMDAKPEVKPETVKPEQISPKLEPRRPELCVLRSKTPDLPASLTLLWEHQTGHVPEEMPLSVSPAPVVRYRDGASPTAVGVSESPLSRGKSPTGLPNLANLTNQKGGRKLKIDLRKGTEGLGFTSILARGAVNGVDLMDRTQEELVAMLRSTKQGECVSVVVARQEEIFLPRELKREEASPMVLEDGREQLMFEVLLNDTGSAGLGISLKGNKSREKDEDLGIFIKSIIRGGAAFKLIAVNGEELLDLSNHVAMETLRHSMSWEGNARGTIQLVLLRAAPSSGSAHSANAQVLYKRDNDHHGSLLRRRAYDPRAASSRGSDLGPTLGLWKSCSLESLQSAMSEARQLSQVPFHRPRPHIVRQSFRAAIDKSYDGPSEPEDGDLSEQSSGRDTPVSGSSRQDQIESGAGKKKKKTKGKKKKKEEKQRKSEGKLRILRTRRRRVDPNDYPTQSRTAPGYPGRGNYYPPKEAQPRSSSQVDPRYYPSSPHRADQHQDVPPSPGTRAPHYETVGRDSYHDASPERYGGGYRDGRQPDPGQKNSMIGAV
uniref:PDZ domain-containing protein n=1 Tax=Oncorhynchus mykiss TaxID=8022 RepID=A0A8C7SXP2_ONCMY